MKSTHPHYQSHIRLPWPLARHWPRDDFGQRPRGLLARPQDHAKHMACRFVMVHPWDNRSTFTMFIHVYPCLSMFIHVYHALQNVSVSTHFVPVAFSEIDIRVWSLKQSKKLPVGMAARSFLQTTYVTLPGTSVRRLIHWCSMKEQFHVSKAPRHVNTL